jgi:Tfp pilus assembly protein PilN
VDRWLLSIIGAWVLGIGAVGWLFFDTTERRAETELAIEQAVQDSARYSAIIIKLDRLRARRDTIAHKLVLIQEIDAGRYIWAHLVDEVSRALPDYTWLTRVMAMGEDNGETLFQITGRTGNTFALTRFLKDLEASPFIRGVQLTGTEIVRDQSERAVHQFILTARFEVPPSELLTTVPLQMGDN